MTESLADRIETILGTPTGRQPSEPEMQRIAIIGADGAALAAVRQALGPSAVVVGSDFAEIEARVLASDPGFIERLPAESIRGPGRIPRQYRPIPESGNRAERRARAARYRNSKP